LAEVPIVRLLIDHADVVEAGKADALDNGDAVFGVAEPIGVAAQRFIKLVVRADVTVLVAAQRIEAAQKIAIEQGHIDVAVVTFGNSGAGAELEQVTGEEALDVLRVLE